MKSDQRRTFYQFITKTCNFVPNQNTNESMYNEKGRFIES